MNAAVCDTHALLFHSGDPRRLGSRAAAHFDEAAGGHALVYVPMAVLLEVTFLSRTGRGGMRVSPTVFFTTLFMNPCFQPFDLSAGQVFAADELTFNRDPFDRLIVAAAQALDLPLITRDASIIESKVVKVLW